MSLRVPAAYAVGLSGCAAIGYAINDVLSSSAACEADISTCEIDTGGFLPFLIGGLFVALLGVMLGARLVFPCVFLAVGVGALTVAVQDGGSFPLLFGGGFVLTALLTLGVSGAMRGFAVKSAAKVQNLVAEGVPAIGTVLSVRDTGVRINDNPRVRLRVRIEADGHPPFEADKTITMPLVQPVRVGERYPVLFLPHDPAEFGLITDITDHSSLPPKLVPVVRRLAAERGGPAPAASLSDEIAKLDALHRSGALTLAEFHEAKAKLLAKD